MKAAVARCEFFSLFRWSPLPMDCQPQSLPGQGTGRLFACLFLNLAVVKCKSASWVELIDTREGLIRGCFWQPALVLMFAMAHQSFMKCTQAPESLRGNVGGVREPIL